MSKFAEHIRNFRAKNGFVLGMLRLLFYPVVQVFVTPIRLVRLLYNSKVLFNGRWGDFTGFVPQTAFNILFYHNRALNIYKYGRSGKSPYLGLGDYPLSRTFYYSLLSLFSFWLAPLITILIGLFGWLLSHMVWIQPDNLEWILFMVGLTLISSLFYINLIQQNYNAFGWLFFPLFVYGIINGYWILAGVALLLSSFGSITVVVLGGFISLMAMINSLNILPIVSVLPAIIKVLLHFLILGSDKNSKGILFSIFKAIGVSDKNVKYKRTKKGKINLLFLYFTFLYLQFLLVYYFIYQEINYFFLIGVIVFWLNKLFIRFADDQSIFMLMMSLGFATLAVQELSLIPLLSYWLMINPFPLTTNVYDPKNIDLVPNGKPFNTKPLMDLVQDFLHSVSKNEKVMMCFNDPTGDYEKVFDGYRRLVEMPHYVANIQQIHFLPDWWGVFELNYEGAPDFWGRDVQRINKNIKTWNVDYIIVYQEAGTELDNTWQQNEFKVLNTLNWAEIENKFNYSKFYKPPTPQWWLLKVPDSLKK